MAGQVRGGRRVFRATGAGRPPPDRDSGRSRAHAVRLVQPGDAARGGAVVLGAGLVRRPPAGRPSGPAERSGRPGAGAARALVVVRWLRLPIVHALRAGDAPDGPWKRTLNAE